LSCVDVWQKLLRVEGNLMLVFQVLGILKFFTYNFLKKIKQKSDMLEKHIIAWSENCIY
jgi:hypothetical protein